MIKCSAFSFLFLRATIQLGGGYSKDILSGQVQMPKGVGLIGGTRPSLISESTEDRGFQNSWGYELLFTSYSDTVFTKKKHAQHFLSVPIFGIFLLTLLMCIASFHGRRVDFLKGIRNLVQWLLWKIWCSRRLRGQSTSYRWVILSCLMSHHSGKILIRPKALQAWTGQSSR